VQVIPVIDLKGGSVVHARRGARESYEPIRSSLTPGAGPVEIAAALLRLHSFTALYIADLDAIQKRGSNVESIEAIREALPAIELWIDAGVADPATYSAWKARDLGRIVIGTENGPDAVLKGMLRDSDAGSGPLLSLDFCAEGPLDPVGMLAQPSLWPDDVIVMTLGRVGSEAGPDLDVLAAVITQARNRRVYAAGGIRSVTDLARSRRLGAAGALIATSLHDGRLSAADLARFS
jgi:phosphoribosylformimino-5-aminoimidazole carboxamide ribotide isomerase